MFGLRKVWYGSALRFRQTRSAGGSAIMRYMTTTRNSGATGGKGLEMTGKEVMDMTANKAMRFVYLRTLPLVKEEELKEGVEEIVENIKGKTLEICERYKGRIVDERAGVHLHTVALAIGSYRVLRGVIGDEIRVGNIIRGGFGVGLQEGGGVSRKDVEKGEGLMKLRVDYWVGKMGLWFSWNRMKMVERMTRNMGRDFGKGFEIERKGGGEKGKEWHSFKVTKCFYNDVCREEGVPELTKIFCALDRAIYSPITVKSHRISFNLRETLGETKEATACQFKFEKQ